VTPLHSIPYIFPTSCHWSLLYTLSFSLMFNPLLSILSLVAFLLLLLVSLSVPIITSISIFRLSAHFNSNLLNSDLRSSVIFGIWGYCISSVELSCVTYKPRPIQSSTQPVSLALQRRLHLNALPLVSVTLLTIPLRTRCMQTACNILYLERRQPPLFFILLPLGSLSSSC